MNRWWTALVLAVSGVAWAQAREEAPDAGDDAAQVHARPVKYRSYDEVDFDVVELTGQLLGPEVHLLQEHPMVRYHPLIELRHDWNDAMSSSVDAVH